MGFFGAWFFSAWFSFADCLFAWFLFAECFFAEKDRLRGLWGGGGGLRGAKV